MHRFHSCQHETFDCLVQVLLSVPSGSATLGDTCSLVWLDSYFIIHGFLKYGFASEVWSVIATLFDGFVAS